MLRRREPERPVLVLGIESSCDETAAAIVADGVTILSSAVASQTELHAAWGGVVPELASRRHVEAIVPVVQAALEGAGAAWADLDGVAVANRPGLIGSLMVGLSYAKALALALGLPLAGVSHIAAHVYASCLSGRPPAFPFLALVVSGGHTELAVYRDHFRVEPVGATRDDAAGEAFDKVARLLGLGYPGGPAVDRLAGTGDPHGLAWPRPRLNDEHGRYDFSFSGLKTAVLYYLERARAQGREICLADVAASFQWTVADALAGTAVQAALELGLQRVVVAGGVAANSGLRAQLTRLTGDAGLDLHIPPASLCTDNAAMVASAGYFRLVAGQRDGLELGAYSYEPAAAAPGGRTDGEMSGDG